jgi:hypothetical protein
MSCYVPSRSIEARPGSPSLTSTLAHSDEAHFSCLHHHPFILPEAVPDHLTKFPDGVDVAALRKSLHHPFTLPDLVPDHLTKFPAQAEVAASHKQHHYAFTIRGSVPHYSIESPAHMDIEASLKQQQQHRHPFTLPDPIPDYLTEFPAHVDVEALRKKRRLKNFRQKQKQPTNRSSPPTAYTACRDIVLRSDYPARKPQGTLEGLGQKHKQAKRGALH